MTNSFSDEWELQEVTAKEWKTTVRTISKYRNLPNGLRWMEMSGRIYIHKPDKAEFLRRRMKRPNPTSKMHRGRPRRRSEQPALQAAS